VPPALKSGSHKVLDPSGPVQVCNGIALPFTTSLFYFLNTFPLPLPSAQQVPETETRFPLSLTHTSIISDPFLSDPLPLLSSHTVYITPSRDEAAAADASCQPPSTLRLEWK